MKGNQLHRKQIIMLALAMMLAMASYLIPLPQGRGQRPLESRESSLSDPTGRTASAEPIVFAREPATVWRFSVTTRIPQKTVAPADSTVRPEDTQLVEPLAARRLLNPQDMGNGDTIRSGNSTFAPVSDPDSHSKPKR